MIANGFRLYRDDQNNLCLDQIADGMVFPLEPDDRLKNFSLGYYDYNFKPVGIGKDKNGIANKKKVVIIPAIVRGLPRKSTSRF